MKEGEYRIEVHCKNGEVKKKSRIQKDAPSRAIVASYLANAGEIYESFAPSSTRKMSDGSSLGASAEFTGHRSKNSAVLTRTTSIVLRRALPRRNGTSRSSYGGTTSSSSESLTPRRV